MKTTLIALSLACCLFGNCASHDVTVSETKDASVANASPSPIETPSAVEVNQVSSSSSVESYISEDLRFERVTFEKTLSDEFQLSISYPRLLEVQDIRPASIKAFNRAAKQLGEGSFSWALNEKGRDGGFANMGYEISFADKQFISVTFTACSICCGAATAGCDVSVLNYDLQRGRELPANELFKPRSGYAQFLMRYCEPELLKRYGDFFSYLKPAERASEYTNFAITKKGINVMFSEYTFAPGSAGVHNIFIPYDIIRDKLNPQSHVAKIANSQP